MKRWKSLVTAALTAGFLLSPVQMARADEQGWGLMVKSPQVGILYLYITDEGFALVVRETGAKFVTHAPEWRVVMYNDQSRVYYVERLSDLQPFPTTGKPRQGRDAVAAAAGGVRAGRSEEIGGLPATQYFITTTSPEGGNREAEVWITHKIIPPAQLHETLKKIFSIDTKRFPPGLPLRIKMADEAGKCELIYDTIKAQKQVVHSASFTYPPTYKRVDSELAVLMDEKSRQKMESILDDSDDLSSILGSTDNNSPTTATAHASSSYSSGSKPAACGSTANSGSGASYATAPRPAATAAPKPPAQGSGDWWKNMFNMMDGK